MELILKLSQLKIIFKEVGNKVAICILRDYHICNLGTLRCYSVVLYNFFVTRIALARVVHAFHVQLKL